MHGSHYYNMDLLWQDIYAHQEEPATTKHHILDHDRSSQQDLTPHLPTD